MLSQAIVATIKRISNPINAPSFNTEVDPKIRTGG